MKRLTALLLCVCLALGLTACNGQSETPGSELDTNVSQSDVGSEAPVNTVLVSPVSMLMIHNPATIAWGDHSDMQKAMDMLAEVKESIINAYVVKTGLPAMKRRWIIIRITSRAARTGSLFPCTQTKELLAAIQRSVMVSIEWWRTSVWDGE